VTGGARDPGFKRRKREDHALTLIHELEESLHDIPRVRRLLIELSRYYDPVLGGGIMDVPQQKAVMEALAAGRPEDARAVVRARYEAYIRDRAHLGREDAP
jgi:hypothetical protein